MATTKRPPRMRSSAFVNGQIRSTISLTFEESEIGLLAELVSATNEVYVDDALKILLIGLAHSPPSQLLMQRQSHLTLLGEFANTVDGIYKQKLAEAEKDAEAALTKHLLERGIIE